MNAFMYNKLGTSAVGSEQQESCFCSQKSKLNDLKYTSIYISCIHHKQ